ncbi:MAG: substrate-binding domain-containing protein [Nocardioides sp.]
MATGGVVAAALALSAAPASAVYTADPDDTTIVTTSTDLYGVGSDTSQNAILRLANGFNATSPPARIATYAATGGGDIPLPGGALIPRPNGSGAGKSKLYGAGNVPEIDFARSSSAQSPAESSAGLQSFPFALDTLVMAVSNSAPSNAPASLTPAQIVGIYNGTFTNWSQVGGNAGVIAPKIPQAGSGTRSFFVAQLQAANGGVAVTLAGSVTDVQEHDDTTIKSDPNAVAPFSQGRAGLLGSTLRLEGGFSANRALYNVVRAGDVSTPNVQAAFGSTGFVCSATAKPLIEAAGFKQLFPPSKGGVCGQPTQSATSNFIVDSVSTTTAVTASVATATSARIVAKVAGSTAPSGTYAFYEGATLLQAGVPLVSGQATRIQPAAPGTHTYRAVFTPAANSPFTASEGSGAVTIASTGGTPAAKAASTIKESFAKTVKAGKRAKGTVTVTLKGVATKATGKIKIKKGSKTLVTKSLSGGKVTVKLPRLQNGKNKLKIVWGGDAAGLPGKLAFTIKQITG